MKLVQNDCLVIIEEIGDGLFWVNKTRGRYYRAVKPHPPIPFPPMFPTLPKKISQTIEIRNICYVVFKFL